MRQTHQHLGSCRHTILQYRFHLPIDNSCITKVSQSALLATVNTQSTHSCSGASVMWFCLVSSNSLALGGNLVCGLHGNRRSCCDVQLRSGKVAQLPSALCRPVTRWEGGQTHAGQRCCSWRTVCIWLCLRGKEWESPLMDYCLHTLHKKDLL